MSRLAPLGVPFVDDLELHADRPALLWDGGSLTYADLADRVQDAVAELGTARRLVLLTAAPDVDTVVRYLACLAAGNPVLLTSAEAATAMRAAYDPDVVITTDGILTIRDTTAHDLHPDLALLLSTSGSTGSPKLVRLSHDNLRANATAIADSLGIRATDRAVTSLPLHYCYGLSVLHSHLARGAGVVLTPLSVTEPCFWKLFREAGVTTLAGVPHTFALLDRVGFADMDLPHLRYVTQAGGQLAPHAVRRYAELGQRRGWDLVVMYGQTEATARMAYLPPDLALSRPTAIGMPVPGGSLRLDGDELVYSGPNVMLGYASVPKDLALGRVVHELRTGDLARQAGDGLFEVVGRRSRFLKLFGLRIDLDRVESALASRGVVAACAGSDEELVVAVEGVVDGVRQVVCELTSLPKAAVHVIGVDALPRTGSGKIDSAAVAALAAPVEAASTVRAVYASVLGVDVHADDTFTSLGGDSLSYVEASVQLEAVLGHLPAEWHLLPVSALQDAPTPRRRWGRAVETGIVLRALAILLVVAHHSHVFRLLGGAHLLLGVAGYNFARFQLTSEPRRERLRGIAQSSARILVPTLVTVCAGLLFTGHYSWQHLLLVHDLIAPLEGYKDFWFVEVLLQVILAATLVLVVFDRVERRFPFLLPLGLLGIGLLARFAVLPAGEGRARLYAPYAIAWLFLWGWAAARALDVRRRLLLTAVLLCAMPGFFLGNALRELVVGGALLALLWIRQVRLPARVVPAVAVLAVSSMYIYLAHYTVLRPLLDWPLLAAAASLASGIAFWQAAVRVERALSARRTRLSTPAHSPLLRASRRPAPASARR